ncbi:MAG TPA: hypothetical protein VMJ64_08245 [Anaerolineales bacterium]|nr:hypothetical protein [Anaerolineales bacterium]
MGNVNATITDILHREEANLAKYRRALRREDQIVLDDLFAAAYKHRAASSLSGHLLPFEAFLLSMLIEEHKEMMRLRDQAHEVIRLRAEIENFRRKLDRLELPLHE